MTAHGVATIPRSGPIGDRSEDGSTMVETMVAATLTVLAAGAIVGNLIVPLSTLEERLTEDRRIAELHAAADGLARIVRAARASSPGGPLVSASTQELVLEVGPSGAELTAAFVEDALVVSPHAATAGGAPLVTGRIAHGIDGSASGFVLLGAGGAEVDDPRDAVAVGLRIVDGARQVERVVALRDAPRSRTGGGG